MGEIKKIPDAALRTKLKEIIEAWRGEDLGPQYHIFFGELEDALEDTALTKRCAGTVEITIEGPPKSGKSQAAGFIRQVLEAEGYKVRYCVLQPDGAMVVTGAVDGADFSIAE